MCCLLCRSCQSDKPRTLGGEQTLVFGGQILSHIFGLCVGYLSLCVCLGLCFCLYVRVDGWLAIYMFVSVGLPVFLSLFVSPYPGFCLSVDRLVGLVVEVSASRAEDYGFDSRLRRDFSGAESYQ